MECNVIVLELYPYFDEKYDGILYRTDALYASLFILILIGTHIKTLELVVIIGIVLDVEPVPAPSMLQLDGLYTLTLLESYELEPLR